MTKCGVFRNRHKWKEVVNDYRICTKCGVTEHYTYIQDCWGTRLQWMYVPFNEWEKAVSRYKEKATKEESQEEALKWLEKNSVTRKNGVV